MRGIRARDAKLVDCLPCGTFLQFAASARFNQMQRQHSSLGAECGSSLHARAHPCCYPPAALAAGCNMTVSASSNEGKRLDRSVQRNIDPTSIGTIATAETRYHAQFARLMPEQQHISNWRLERGAELQDHAGQGVLLGECRLKFR